MMASSDQPNFVVTVKDGGPNGKPMHITDFTVVSVGVIISFPDSEESEVSEALVPWHRVDSISAIQRGSIATTFPL